VQSISKLTIPIVATSKGAVPKPVQHPKPSIIHAMLSFNAFDCKCVIDNHLEFNP
jgi:hypothetical protein